jgi:dipeptidyl aminopeptidase/acylaminoacyl peptidase
MEKPVRFYSEGQAIVGNLGLPHKGAPGIIMSHGFESSKDGKKWLALAPQFYKAGVAYLRFTYRGCGKDQERSEGQFEDTTLSGRIKDYTTAINFSENTEMDTKRLGVIGSSFGGMVALAAQDSRIKAMVTLATPARFQMPAREQLDEEFFELPWGSRLRTGFFRDVQQYDMCHIIGKINCPVLIIHGSADEIVPVKDAYDFYNSAKEPKRLVIIEGGSHALNEPKHLEQITGLTLNWFKQYL